MIDSLEQRSLRLLRGNEEAFRGLHPNLKLWVELNPQGNPVCYVSDGKARPCALCRIMTREAAENIVDAIFWRKLGPINLEAFRRVVE